MDPKGGLFWNSQKTYKASISNELYISFSALLHLATKEKTYLVNALDVYNWFVKQSTLVKESGKVEDGIGSDMNKTFDPWSYNQGVILAGIAYICQSEVMKE